jgi:hypothetical protein
MATYEVLGTDGSILTTIEDVGTMGLERETGYMKFLPAEGDKVWVGKTSYDAFFLSPHGILGVGIQKEAESGEGEDV